MSDHRHLLLHLLFLVLGFQESHSWSLFSSSSKETDSSYNHRQQRNYQPRLYSSEFSMDVLQDRRGLKLVENAKEKLVGSNSCWQSAYRNLFAGCSEVIAMEEKRSRLAWHLSGCFQIESGRPPFPTCNSKSAMKTCLSTLNEESHGVYLEFYLETNSICHQLQMNSFKQETERLVTDLKTSSEFAEEKLERIDETSDNILRNSNEITESLSSVFHRTQQLAETSKNIEDHVDVVLKHSSEVYQQSKSIAASQAELQQGQEKMKRKLEQEMETIHDSYNNLERGIDSLKTETIEIEKEIGTLGDAMSTKMKNLQITADDIENIAGISLNKQKELLDGQSDALRGLEFLTDFQTKALEESGRVLQQLTELGHEQQEELIKRQEQLEQAHDHLIRNSKSILDAQKAFESRQESMFIALDKLFDLQTAIIVESRFIKAFFLYSLSIFIIYLLTSTRQTYRVRPILYIGLCSTILIECLVLRMTTTFEIEKQTRIVNFLRMLFLAVSSLQLLRTIYTYRDYERLNHEILLTLMSKINGMQRMDKQCYLDYDDDSDVEWTSWIDSNFSEDMDKLEDPDYFPSLVEKVEENPIAVISAKKYNLRHRR